MNDTAPRPDFTRQPLPLSPLGVVETRARVLRVADGMAWVAASEKSGCGACQSQESCGISGLGKYFSRRRPPVPVAHADAAAGDELLLCVNEAELLRAGLFAYLLPALLAVSGAALADARGLADAGTALAAIAGFVAGLLLARRFAPIPALRARRATDPVLPNQGDFQ